MCKRDADRQDDVEGGHVRREPDCRKETGGAVDEEVEILEARKTAYSGV
jgi:hypothetical protein